MRLRTLLVASPCAQRADRIALLMLTAAELPNFVRDNPPSSTAPPTVLPLAREARQFLLAGEPELADRYFPWLVNIMSPAYWVYLVMAVTILFNMMRGYSKFRLWRIDAAREKIETALKQLVDPAFTHAQMRAMPGEQVMAAPERRAAAQTLVDQLHTLRARCQRQTTLSSPPWATKCITATNKLSSTRRQRPSPRCSSDSAIRTREQAANPDARAVSEAGRTIKGCTEKPSRKLLHDLNKTGPFRDRFWCMLKHGFSGTAW